MVNIAENEEWTEIRGYPNYLISNYGRIYNWKTNRMVTICSGKYKTVLLYNDGEGKRFSIHRLVAMHFVPGEDAKLVVNHIDGNKNNNHDENLEWCTQRDNNIHAIKSGLNFPGSYQKRKIIIIETGAMYDGVVTCAKDINGDFRNVYACLSGKRKTHRGYHFEYVS